MGMSEIGDFIMILMIINGALSYYYGRGKVRFPIAAAVVGVLLSIIPPLGIIFVTVLMLKNEPIDIEEERAKEERFQEAFERRRERRNLQR